MSKIKLEAAKSILRLSLKRKKERKKEKKVDMEILIDKLDFPAYQES